MKEPDILDEASNLSLLESESIVAERMMLAQIIPKGEPGECIECGEHNQRLVHGKCSPCRDGRY